MEEVYFEIYFFLFVLLLSEAAKRDMDMKKVIEMLEKGESMATVDI